MFSISRAKLVSRGNSHREIHMRRLACLVAAVVLGVAPMARAAGSTATHQALSTLIPEVRLQGATLVDAIEFLRDISSVNLHVNWRALEAAGIGKDTVLNIRLRDVTLQKLLRVLLTEASPSAPLTYYAEEGVIEVTTAELADQRMITRVYPVDDLLMEIPDFEDAPDFSINQGGSANGRGSSGRSSRGGGYGGGGGGGGGLFPAGGVATKGADKGSSKSDRAEALLAMIRETVRPEIWRENGGTASIRYYNGHLVVTAPRSVHEAIGGATE